MIGIALHLVFSAAIKKPNIVVIMADDLGYGDLGFTGSSQIKTPNIDRIAAEGIQFTNGYVSAPVCAPSRAGFLTGRYQQRFGFQYNIGEEVPGHDFSYNGLAVSETTIADRLKAAGYKTGLVGKWHQGSLSQYHPTKRGFDEFWGMIDGHHSYFDYKGLESNYTEVRPFKYLTDELGSQGESFIERHKAKPFFLFMSFNAPHGPMHATEADLKLFEKIPQLKRRTYCAMVHRLDINVGRVMASLKKNGLDESTLVVFLSDNGGPCQDNGSLNAPFDGKKGTTMEGGIHVPFLMRWKGKIEPRREDAPVITLDLTPTFVKLATGVDQPKAQTDGLDLAANLFEKRGISERNLMWVLGPMAAIRRGATKLINAQDRLPMLFNLNQDPSEQRNLVLEQRSTVERMLKDLSDWRNACPQPAFVNSIYWHAKQLDMLDETFPLVQPKPDEGLVWKPSIGVRNRISR